MDILITTMHSAETDGKASGIIHHKPGLPEKNR
jgi:hypothetical protein